MKSLLKHLRAKIFAGILLVLPLGITFFVLKFVFQTLDNILGQPMLRLTWFLFQREVAFPGLGILAFFFLLYLLGLIGTNVLGKKLIGWTDRLFTNIPVVKNIYLSSKQLTDAFSASRKGSFRQAVFVEFPQDGNFVLGFITNELKDLRGENRITVFIPTAFFPPQGFLLFLPREKIIPSHLTIEEAIKTIMSVGIVSPQSLQVTLLSKEREKDSVENLKGIQYLHAKIEGGP